MDRMLTMGNSWYVKAKRAQTADDDETWEPSSGRWASSGMGSPTECWTLSSSESPSVAVECSLLDVLETTGSHLQKYLLSAKACAGILRRATRRGKQLPEALQKALESVVGSQPLSQLEPSKAEDTKA